MIDVSLFLVYFWLMLKTKQKNANEVACSKDGRIFLLENKTKYS